jgi:16S rRNA (cytosine967-C5)-methyltransferase
MTFDTRAAAARSLGAVLSGKSLNQALPLQLEKVAAKDRGLLQQLCYGTLRSYPRLLAVLEQLLIKPMKDKDNDVLALMLLGLYQLEETRIPDHAAVGATVAATKALKKPWARGLTNAVLRRFQRERESLLANLDDAATAAHPDWLYKRLVTDWPGQYSELLSANNQQAPMTLRVNTRLQPREQYLQQLQQADIPASSGSISPDAIYLDRAVEVLMLPGFESGSASVQDEAAQLAALLLAAKPGDRVLDACAAPGGKTCHILERQPQLQELLAVDIDPARLTRVEDNLARLGLSATVMAADLSQPIAEFPAESFDRILVDAPCSASGVIRRHPDIKVLRRESDIAQLAGEQIGILNNLWPLLKAGGTLLYATCSVLEEENSSVVKDFLAKHPDAELEIPNGNWGVQMSAGRQLLPATDGPDGLFYALLHKAI